jgi:ketosteroid isomerase-like protein
MPEKIQSAATPLEVIGQLRDAVNAHDLEALVACFATDVISRQPAHPGRDFNGNQQVRDNWSMILAGVPDLHAKLLRSAQDGDTVWSEWDWSGTRLDGAAHLMRGVTVNQVSDGLIVSVAFYMEPVEAGGSGVEAAIQAGLGAGR